MADCGNNGTKREIARDGVVRSWIRRGVALTMLSRSIRRFVHASGPLAHAFY